MQILSLTRNNDGVPLYIHAYTSTPTTTQRPYLERARGKLGQVFRHGTPLPAGVLRLVPRVGAVERRPPLTGGLLGQAGHVLVGQRLAPDGPRLGLRVRVDAAVAALGDAAPHEGGGEEPSGEEAGDGACGRWVRRVFGGEGAQ